MKKQQRLIQLDISTLRGNKELCTIEYSHDDTIEMIFSCAALGQISVIGNDIFEALCTLRLKLEEHGYFILCNGARVDAYPSRMSRQMGQGGKLYLFTMGKQSKREDLVNMFDSTELQRVGTVAAQRIAFDAWLRSL